MKISVATNARVRSIVTIRPRQLSLASTRKAPGIVCVLSFLWCVGVRMNVFGTLNKLEWPTAVLLNKQLNFSVKKKAQTTHYVLHAHIRRIFYG